MRIDMKSNFKYLDSLLETYLKRQFSLSLVPVQLEVLKTMLIHDNVLFTHGRWVGATFLLAVLAAILKSIDPDINMAVASETTRQAEMVNDEFKQKFNKHDLKPLNIVTIDEAVLGGYDVLLLDEMTTISKENVEAIVIHIENKSISKVIATCGGYRRYFNIAYLANYIHAAGNPNNVVITKDYEDMPGGFIDSVNIEEAKATFEYEEDFNMEYKGYII